MVEWRGEQQDQEGRRAARSRYSSTAAIAALARGGLAAPPIGRSTTGRWSRSGTRRSWARTGGTIVEEGSAVPIAVPAVAFERPPERLHVGSPALRARTLRASAIGAKAGQDGVQENSRARRSRPDPRCPLGSCRRSSRPTR